MPGELQFHSISLVFCLFSLKCPPLGRLNSIFHSSALTRLLSTFIRFFFDLEIGSYFDLKFFLRKVHGKRVHGSIHITRSIQARIAETSRKINKKSSAEMRCGCRHILANLLNIFFKI